MQVTLLSTWPKRRLLLLEVCVHTSAADVPPAFTLLKIKGPDLEVPSITTGTLPKDWQIQLEVTRDSGTRLARKQ